MAALSDEAKGSEAFLIPGRAVWEIEHVQQHIKVSIQPLTRAKPHGQWPLCHGLAGALLQPFQSSNFFFL